MSAGQQARAIAERKLSALLERVATGDHARTDASVPQVVARYLTAIEDQPIEYRKCGRKTLASYRGYLDKHIEPLLTKYKARDGLDPELLDSFYGERRMRKTTPPANITQ